MPIALLIIATALKLVIAARTYGTNDIFYWETFLRVAGAGGGVALYRDQPIFIHPPFIVHYIQALGWLGERTGVPFRFWLRAASSLADVGTFLAVTRLARLGALRAGSASLSLLAVAPVSIMVAGFHGNTDPVMVMFAVLAVLLAAGGRPAWMVGAAIGMALNIKFAAVVFTPALFFFMRGPRARLALAGAAAATVILASLPYIAEAPLLLAGRIVSYSSLSGHWGLTRLLPLLGAGGGSPVLALYLRFGTVAMMLSVLVLAIAMNRGRRRVPLFTQCGISVFLFMVFTPGFGVQYLDWLVPFSLAAGFWPALALQASAGTFLFMVYGYWAREFPWYYANSLEVGDWRGRRLVGAEMLAWLMSAVTALWLARRALARNHRAA